MTFFAYYLVCVFITTLIILDHNFNQVPKRRLFSSLTGTKPLEPASLGVALFCLILSPLFLLLVVVYIVVGLLVRNRIPKSEGGPWELR